MIDDIAFALMESGQSLESVRAFPLPAAFAFLEKRIEANQKRRKEADKKAGKKTMTSTDFVKKMEKKRRRRP